VTAKEARKALRRAQEAAHERDVAEATPRDLARDVSIRGIGFRRFQIARLPSFEPALSWDIRELPLSCSVDGSEPDAPNELRLYRSQGIEGGSRMLLGYREVPARSVALASVLEAVAAIHVPLIPAPRLLAVADGVRLELLVHISPDCYARFRWVEGTEITGWRKLDDFARETLAAFEALEGAG
jgi:hypothetical protein